MKRIAEPPTLILIVALLLLPQPVSPALITVDGGCPHLEGECTLVDAITAANTDTAIGDCEAGSGSDILLLACDVSLASAFSGENGLPTVSSGILVLGNGFTVGRAVGSEPFRILEVLSSGTLTLDGVNVDYGYVESYYPGGGGILNRGTLTLSNSSVGRSRARHNHDFQYPAYGYGSGIKTLHSLTMIGEHGVREPRRLRRRHLPGRRLRDAAQQYRRQ